MHPNEELITKFYDSLSRYDAAGMADCYHRDIVFSDPAFGTLKGDEARAMWAMLCSRGKGLAITTSNVRADDSRGSAHWEATYSFSQTGRKVHNIIDAAFEFKDGKIIRHADTFDLWRWAGMALGLKGRLLGWLPAVQNKIRATARAGLTAYMEKHPA
jgi:ketosteroid isomerase-like protein